MENLNSDPDDHSQCLSQRTEMLNPHQRSQIDHSEFQQFSDYFYADDENKDDHDDEIEDGYDNDDRTMMTSLSKLSLESFDDTDYVYADAVERSAEKLEDYASENEGARKKKVRSNKKKFVTNEDMETDDADEDEEEEGPNVFGMKSRSNVGCYSGESDYGGGLMVITRPKGGIRTLCMDMEEVKACNDLGFELEHERMMEIPGSSRISLSASTLDTSSGGNSPIASWRISSPGDDPRDVKARLKVWAQAVAIVSTSPVLKF